MIGQTVSHYRILEKIGGGGMGVVYKAEDIRLARPVALKFLPEDFARDSKFIGRFRREAHAASVLDHPNICAVHDIEELDGQLFIVMQFVEGMSLRDRLATQPLMPDEVIELGIELADALDVAHAHGIVHRDIKPGNIMLTERGRAKILDFGLAKLVDEPSFDVTEGTLPELFPSPAADPGSAHESLTRAGAAVGTPAYMSPEQITGPNIDPRSDLFSFGLVLYEMATRRRAFDGPSRKEMLEAILTQDPLLPSRLNPQYTPAFDEIIRKLLEKDREMRYQTAADVRADLKRLQRDSSWGHGMPLTSDTAQRTGLKARFVGLSTMARLDLLIVALLGLALIAGGIFRVLHRGGNETAATPGNDMKDSQRTAAHVPSAHGAGPKGIAVLYFSNLSQDSSLDWLNRGLCEMLTTNLAQVQGLEVLSTERVFTVMRRLGKDRSGELDPGAALEAAHDAGAGVFITGALMRMGPQKLRLDVHVQDTNRGRILFSDKAEAKDVQGIFGAVDAVTGRIAGRLLPEGSTPGSLPSIEAAATANFEAYHHYQLGVDFEQRFLFAEAIRELEDAVRRDSSFALAYFHLARCYEWASDLRKADEMNRKVAQMQARLPRRQQMLFEASRAQQGGDIEAAMRSYAALLRSFPDESRARIFMADILINLGEYDREIALLQEGLRADPKDEEFWNALSYAYAMAGRLDESLEANERYHALRPNDPAPPDSRGDALFISGRNDEALAAYKRVMEIKPDWFAGIEHVKLAAVYADQRKFDLAESSIAAYTRNATGIAKVYAPLYRSQVQQLRGDLEGARQSYRLAIAGLARAGQFQAAGDTLLGLAIMQALTGSQVRQDLAFARGQKLSDEELPAVSLLESVGQDEVAAERTLKQYASSHPWVLPRGLEIMRARNQVYAAFARKDAHAVLTAASRHPDLQVPEFQLIKAASHLQLKEYTQAGQELRRGDIAGRSLSNMTTMRNRLPIAAHLLHFYQAQWYEARGQRAKAIAEYGNFLAPFQKSPVQLAEIEEARGAVNRLHN